MAGAVLVSRGAERLHNLSRHRDRPLPRRIRRDRRSGGAGRLERKKRGQEHNAGDESDAVSDPIHLPHPSIVRHR
jgi:hypothetical protein